MSAAVGGDATLRARPAHERLGDATDPSAELFLGIDVGTQGTKAVLVDAAGAVVARAAVAYGLIDGLLPGAAEQHPDTWIDAVRTVAARLWGQADPRCVRGVGVAGQQHGFVALDARDQVIRPAKLWCDTATSAQARELSAAFGRHVPTGFTASKILWLKQCEPDSWRRLRTVLLPHDYVNLRLTGTASMEPGDASGTGLFDIVRRGFCAADVVRVDPRLGDMLPPLRVPGELAGRIDAAGARLLGVAPGTPVSTGGGDNMMSAIGSGAVLPGVVVLSLGTSGTVFTHVDAPPFPGAGHDPAGLVASFCGSAGGWLPLLCVMNVTGVTEEVRAATARSHEQLTALAAAEPAGCGGMLWLPFLAGERVPDLPDASGTMVGMRAGALRPGLLYRAAIEGTSLGLAWGIERLRAAGIAIAELRLVGGAARNDLWRQVLADVCEVPVRPLAEGESAALGAALQAMWAVRRQADPDIAIADVIAPFVVPGAATAPGASVTAYRECRRRWAAELARLYGVG